MRELRPKVVQPSTQYPRSRAKLMQCFWPQSQLSLVLGFTASSFQSGAQFLKWKKIPLKSTPVWLLPPYVTKHKWPSHIFSISGIFL
jgi:hypothetical protein